MYWFFEDKFEHSSVQIDVPELDDKITKWIRKNIKRSWMNPKEYVDDVPHISILYGLPDNSLHDVRRAIKGFNRSVKFVLGELNYFDAPESDILYISVLGKDLHELHDLLSKLSQNDKYDKYVPHITIAYLKKGVSGQFAGLKPFVGVFHKNSVIVSKKDGSKEPVLLLDKAI